MKRSVTIVTGAAVALGLAIPAANAAPSSVVPSASVQAGSMTAKTDLPPLYASEMARARTFVDGMIAAGPVVPQPKDPGGGYTHEQHKRNFRAMYLAGQLFQITGEAQYREYIRAMLLEYAEMYPTLGDHPAKANQNVGRLFWQVLNDAMWLVHTVQAYEAIRDTLPVAERENIDNNVFRPAAKFLSVDSKATFNKIHNHATWATAGVGMTGYLLGDQDMVDRALLGSDKSGKAGFIRQTELLFSPDGYYTEGPYYQRFAMLPFIVFGDAIERNEPERKIFQHRDGILLKAINTTIQLTYGGLFFPFNDAIKDKSLNTAELYEGVAIAYGQTKDPGLLSIAEFQGRTVLRPSGLELTRDLAAGKAKPFDFRSVLLSDGPEGNAAAIAVLREGEDEGLDHTALVAKNASQGFGHGHFDKLSWQLYDNGNEVVRDYGAARFLNIEAKEGGRYLPENETWAKQTIAHNTLVVNEQSHFGGDVKLADQHAPQQLYFSDKDGLQATTAAITTAYPDAGIAFTRTLAMVDVEGLDSPVILDVLRAEGGNGDGSHQLDLPLHYNGHIMQVGFDTDKSVTSRPVLGNDNGYQHIWVDAVGQPEGDKSFLTILLDGRFYTYRFAAQDGMEVILAESGANDPNFNLRRQPIIIQRMQSGGEGTFVSALESHGLYDGATEQTIESNSQIASLKHQQLGQYDLVEITTLGGKTATLAISYDQDANKKHTVEFRGKDVSWTGFMAVVQSAGEM
ncbi:MAG: alginate lyase family protein [Erythrobacter sp.]